MKMEVENKHPEPLVVGKSEKGYPDPIQGAQTQGCRHNLQEPWASGGSNGWPPGGDVTVGYPRRAPDPNDPPETWLDRMAGEVLGGMYASGDLRLTPVKPDDLEGRARHAYMQAAAMLAEKRRREKKEVEE